MQKEIEERVKKLVDALSKFAFVKAIYLFGSRQIGKATKISDIDICVIDDPSTSLKEKFKVYQYSEYPFDVSLFSQLSLPIQFNALKGECVFCKDEEFVKELKPKIWFEYFDMQPIWEEGLKIRKKAGHRVIL